MQHQLCLHLGAAGLWSKRAAVKQRVHLLLAAFLVAAVSGLVLWSPWMQRQPEEPVYRGHHLSYWLTNASLDSVLRSSAPKWNARERPEPPYLVNEAHLTRFNPRSA
jgi:hypothetical protein